MTKISTDVLSIINQIRKATEIASKYLNNPEGKLRELVSPIWEQFLKEKRVGLSFLIRDEYTLANGRADTVFNKLILEYKKPNTIHSNNDKNRKLISQVQGYILDLAKKERFSKERLLGVAFDGNYFLFMRYMKKWHVEEPVPVSEKSLELFLKNLEKLTSKAALIPENLIHDFAIGKGALNKVAAECVKAFYSEIHLHGAEKYSKEHVFFEQWKVQFAEVHGTLEQKKIDQKTLFDSYGFSKKEQTNFNVLAFFFALNSYYALLMKLLSFQVVGYYTLRDLTGLPLHEWEHLSGDELRQKCGQLEEGGIFRNIGIRNFLEGDLFSWYVQAWNPDIDNTIRQIIRHLNDYDPETMELAPDETRDILKKLYQNLVPKQIRHDLGEYYTPDWLAERCLNQLNYNGEPKLRLLDPGCGSGTFLILAIKRAKEYAAKGNISPADTLNAILKNIFGFDLNPLAVISARTNYLLAIADLLKYKTGEITIPIYLCDSINPPQARIADEMTLFQKQLPYEVKTAVGNFYLPAEVVGKRKIMELANLLEDGVKSKLASHVFLEKAQQKLGLSQDNEQTDACLIGVFDKLVELEEKGINGIWARIIKNAFAPLFVGQFDLVVGNPPWVTWGNLPKEYRVNTQYLWEKYNLFEHKGLDARLGKSGDDISVLMTYVSIDRYLHDTGKLCFVITQSLFQSVGGGQGFRLFSLGKNGIPIRVNQVDDMVSLQPFEGATNRTSIFSCTKGSTTKYPVMYCIWKKRIKASLDFNLTFNEINRITKRIYLQAKPINTIQSPWITAREKAHTALKKIIGKSFYQARMGAHTGGANGIYWININEAKGNLVNITNLFDIGKNKYKCITENVEKKFVYPLMRGKEVKSWSNQTSINIILPYNNESGGKAVPEPLLEKEYPNTYSFFVQFKDELLGRSHYKKHFEAQSAPFYSTYNVGSYTFSDYKVVWKYISTFLECSIIGKQNTEILGTKVIIPDTKLVLIDFTTFEEANYCCAILNSCLSKFVVKAYVVETQLAPHILKSIRIPKYQTEVTIHTELSKLSHQCHEKTAAGIDVTDLEEQIDELAAELWGLTNEELRDIKESLEELR